MAFKPSTSTVPVQESRHTFVADASIESKHVGYACKFKPSGDTLTVTLATEGTDDADVIIGQISVVELPKNPNDQPVCTVTILGGYRLACKPDATFKVGDSVVGGPDGLVVPSGAAAKGTRMVVSEIDAVVDGAVGVVNL